MSKLSEMFRKNIRYKNFGYNFQIIDEVRELFYYIHDSNQLPSFPTSEFPSIPKTEIFYEKKFFNLLPAPYETNCFDYSNTVYKSQSECINEHIIQKYLKNDCLPKTNEMVTYVIDNYNYSKFKHKFCENVSIPTKYIDSLTKICLKSCNEVLYEIWRLKHEHVFFLYPMNTQNIAFEHKPEMELTQYLVNFRGLLGLWHGLSFIDLKNLTSNLIKRRIFMFNRIIKLRKYFPPFDYFKKISNIKVNTRKAN
jgi:hypothetical protein